MLTQTFHLNRISFLCVCVHLFKLHTLDVYDYNCVFACLFRVESIKNIEPQPPHRHGFYSV